MVDLIYVWYLGGRGIHRSFQRSREPRYIDSFFVTTPPYGVHTIIHLHSRVTKTHHCFLRGLDQILDASNHVFRLNR